MKAKVRISKEIWRRLSGSGGLAKALGEFVGCVESGSHPPRKFKASGKQGNGEVFEPYRALNLHHHHLHRSSDPIIVLQLCGEELRSVAISSHAIFFQGDKMAWLKLHHEQIDWDGCEALYEEVMAYSPPSQ